MPAFRELWDFEDAELQQLMPAAPIFLVPNFNIGVFNRLDYCQWCGRTVMRRIQLDKKPVWIASPIGCPSCCRKHGEWWTPRFPIETFPENEPHMPLGILLLEFLANFNEREVEANDNPTSQSTADGPFRIGQDALNPNPG